MDHYDLIDMRWFSSLTNIKAAWIIIFAESKEVWKRITGRDIGALI